MSKASTNIKWRSNTTEYHTTTVTSTQAEGESAAAFMARHLAEVEAMEDAIKGIPATLIQGPGETGEQP